MRSPLRPSQGFTLLEVLVALVLLGVGILGLSGNAALVSRLVGNGSRLTLAATVASNRVEQLRGLPCGSARPGRATTRGVEEQWTVAPLGERAVAIELSVAYPLRAPGTHLMSTQRFRGAVPCTP